MDRAVIFYTGGPGTGTPKAWDVRFGCQALPAGSVVCGLLAEGGGRLVLPGHCTTPEWDALLAVVREAEGVLGLAAGVVPGGPGPACGPAVTE